MTRGLNKKIHKDPRVALPNACHLSLMVSFYAESFDLYVYVVNK